MSQPESGQLATSDSITTANNSPLATRHSPLDWAIRPYRESDIPAIVAVWNAAFAADGVGDIIIGEDEQRTEFGRPNFDPARQVIIVEGPSEGLRPPVQGVLRCR